MKTATEMFGSAQIAVTCSIRSGVYCADVYTSIEIKVGAKSVTFGKATMSKYVSPANIKAVTEIVERLESVLKAEVEASEEFAKFDAKEKALKKIEDGYDATIKAMSY